MNSINLLKLLGILIILSACSSTESNSRAELAPTKTSSSISSTVLTHTVTYTPPPSLTATFTTTPTQTPTAIPTLTATATPLIASTPDVTHFQTYIHPSNKFKLDIITRGDAIFEIDNAVFIFNESQFIMAGFFDREVDLNPTSWRPITQSLLDQYFIDLDVITAYDKLERIETDGEDSYLIRMTYSSEEAALLSNSEGFGEVVLQQQDNVTYMLVLLAAEYNDVELEWGIVKESFMIN